MDSTLAIIHCFAMQAFALVIIVRAKHTEHYRYLVGCDLGLCYRYLKNKWFAIDPILSYALQNTSPILVSDIVNTSEGQRRMRRDAIEHGFRDGIAIPAHSRSSLVGVLYLGTSEGLRQAKRSLESHRILMRALAMELLEWWNARRRTLSMIDFNLDQLDIELLRHASRHTTMREAADNLGISLYCTKKRYERLYKKLDAPSQRHAISRAIEAGLIEPIDQL